MTQSNEPTTKSMNEAIARFDGWEPNYGGEGSPFYSKKTEFIPRFAMIVDMQYHTSWDWLRPVIDKISEYILVHPERVKPVIEMKIVVNIQAAHEMAYKFCKWYNQQKQNDGTT